MKELTIGQMARLNGVSEQALRLYDRSGLFSPMYRDEENGYRYYDIRQSAVGHDPAHEIPGHVFKDIRSQLEDFDSGGVQEDSGAQFRAIDEQMRELQY